MDKKFKHSQKTKKQSNFLDIKTSKKNCTKSANLPVVWVILVLVIILSNGGHSSRQSAQTRAHLKE